MSKQTPGPWIAKRLASYNDPGWVISWPDKCGQHMRRLDYRGNFSEADAHLIAAAPDLLEALESMRDWLIAAEVEKGAPLGVGYAANVQKPVVIEKMRAALARAKSDP